MSMSLPPAGALAPDPAVPHRDLLLDGGRVGSRLGTSLGAERVAHCTPTRIKYQVGRSLRVLYRLATDRSSQLVALRTFRRSRAEEIYREAAKRAVSSGELAAIAPAPELGAVLFTFPNDRKLGGLPALAGAGRLVAYAPEKSATVQLSSRDPRAPGFAKVYADDEGARARDIHAALWEPAAELGLRLPRAIDYAAERWTLVCEAVPGKRLSGLTGSQLDRGVRGLGAAIARFHQLGPPSVARPFERHDPERLLDAAAVIARARPDLGSAARRAVEPLREGPPDGGPDVCLHGDVHLKNALLNGRGVALIDLDQVATGPAAADIGSLLAAFRYAAIVGAISPAAGRAYSDAFCAGYGRVRELPDPETLRRHLAAALISERALRAVTRVRRRGLAALATLLEEAEAIGSGPGVR